MGNFTQCKRARGMVTVVFAVLLLAVVSVAVSLVLDMAAAGATDASIESNSPQPLFLAESGLEYALWQHSKNGVACDATLDTTQALAGGTFTIRFISYDAALGLCRIQVEGQAGNLASRTIEAEIRNAATGVDFTEIVDYADTAALDAVWPATYTKPDGFALRSAQTATADGSGSMYFETDSAGKPTDNIAGYREYALTPFYTATGLNVDLTLDYRKEDDGTGLLHVLSVSLVDSGGTAVTLWSDTTPNTVPAGTWQSASVLNFALPAATTFNRLRVDIDLKEKQKDQVRAWIDNIVLTNVGGGGGGGGTGAGLLVDGWTEVVQ